MTENLENPHPVSEVPDSETGIPDESDHFYDPPYARKDGCICLCKAGREGITYLKLANFIAWIDRERILDDGHTVKRVFTISGTRHDGTPLPPVQVLSDDLIRMDWFRNGWPSDCNIMVIPSAEKHVQCAIRSTSVRAEKQRVFEMTGWRQVDGVWTYLFPGIGTGEVHLIGKQESYYLEPGVSAEDLHEAGRLMHCEAIAPTILRPCLAFAFLSPLNEFLHQAGCEPKFILTLVGHTGCRKSSLAGWLLSFFGQFSSTDLPMSFRDTANSIDYNAYTLKDVLTCIDDYHPVARQQLGSMQTIMQTVTRAFGDRAARNRLDASCNLQEARFPQGNALITAEDIPDVGESAVSRLFVLEMSEKDLELSRFSELQRLAAQGTYRRVMAAYIDWLRVTYLSDTASVGKFVRNLETSFRKLRERLQAQGHQAGVRLHGRTYDAAVCLEIGCGFFLSFLENKGALSAEEAREQQNRFQSMIFSLACRQTSYQHDANPAYVFVQTMVSLLESNHAVVVPVDSAGNGRPPNFIGYEDDRYYYICLEETCSRVAAFCARKGDAFALSSKRLAKVLCDEHILEPVNGKNTATQRFGRDRCRVARLLKEAVFAMLEDE